MANLSKTTKDHEEIKSWAEERGAHPACVKGTGEKEDIGILRLDFPGYSGEDSLQQISWDEFFEKFDERGLALLYQEETAGGERSNFNKIVSSETAAEADEPSHGRQRGGAKRSARKSSGSKTASNSTAAKKTSAAPAKKGATKKAAATKTPAKAAAPAKKGAKKVAAKKTAAKKAPAKKTAAKKSPAKKTAAKKATTKKAVAKKTTAKSAAKRKAPATKKTAGRRR